MKKFLVRWSTAGLAALALSLGGCGGGGGGDDSSTTPNAPPSSGSVQSALTQAAAQPSNDTSTNSTASFSVLQGAGVPAVQVSSPPKVNFAVFSDGKVKSDVTLANTSMIIAKLVPGTNGDPDKWVSYTYRTESTASGAANTGPGGKPVLASATQATSDAKPTSAAATQLVYNPDGYYTYTFSTDITDPTKTNGVTFEPNRTHRVAIQLRYTNAAGKDIRVNPYFDFKIDSAGKSVAVDASQTRKMVDIATCNGCHDKLALHGGGRVDTQFCVMCHNPSTVDAQSGNNLNLATMVHKIHSGRELHHAGETYAIWGFNSSKYDYSEVGFPQPTRNCAGCHTGTNPATPQGDNWKNKPTKEACLSCHLSGAGSAFEAMHVATLKIGPSVAAITNTTCSSCHGATAQFSAEKAHWVQEMANAGLYKGVIESVTVTKAPTATAAGTISVKYAVINPATGAAYDLREGCTGTPTTDQKGNPIPTCESNYRWDANLDPTKWGKPPNKFGTFTLGLGINTLAQTFDDISGTASGVLPAYRGVKDVGNRFTMDVTVPAGAKGNARLLLLGSVAERRVDPLTGTPKGAVPAKLNADVAYVPVKNDLYEFTVTGTGARATTTARRQIVSNDTCNSCHGLLGLPLSSDPDKPGFHKGVRNNSEGCANCHNANQAGGYTLMADGSKTLPGLVDSQTATNTQSFLHESYEAKRFVHGIHYGAKRNYPFTHCMNVGGEYNKDGTNKLAGGANMGAATCVNQYPGETLNFTAEVAYPANLANCSNCHVKDSWKQDRSTLGSVVFKPAGAAALDWLVISPKAATCTGCHDSKAAQTHVKTVGATFGTLSQNDLLNKGMVFESCEGCHALGSAIGVDTVHGLK